MFKERLLKREPIDFRCFVVDLRERHFEWWAPNSDTHPRECNSTLNSKLIIIGAPYKEGPGHAFVIHPPRYIFLNLSHDVIRCEAWFRLCAHTLTVNLDSRYLPYL